VSKMLDAAPAATALFSLPDDADDSETPWPYFNDRPLVARRRNTGGVSPALDAPGCVQNARRSSGCDCAFLLAR
jgi:hypothetical protein